MARSKRRFECGTPLLGITFCIMQTRHEMMWLLQTRDRQMRSSVEDFGLPFTLLFNTDARTFSTSKKIELSCLLCLFFHVLQFPPSFPHAARRKAQALHPGLLSCLLLSTTLTSRLLASCLATTFFARLLASMLAGTLASALASSFTTRLVARSLASTSSTFCHLDVLSHGFDCVLLTLMYHFAVPHGEFPFKSPNPDVPEEGYATDCQEQGETDRTSGIHGLLFAIRLARVVVCVEFKAIRRFFDRQVVSGTAAAFGFEGIMLVLVVVSRVLEVEGRS